MAHIHTNPGEHDHTASAFIVRTDTAEPQLLLHVHKKLGVLLQPGGHVELYETPWQAIAHELEEEAGYELSQLKLLQPPTRIKHLDNAILHPQPIVQNTHNFDPAGNHKHTDVSYAFVTQSEPLHTPGEGETTTLRWVTLAELESLKAPSEIFENVRQIGRFVLTQILDDWEEVSTSHFEL
jgi:8-oxo-dGTP pyrophosphatase MutT (NUDIX family)